MGRNGSICGAASSTDLQNRNTGIKKTSATELLEFDRRFGVLLGGCDEAGRGPLAGPLVCAACIMPLDDMIVGINDSKKVRESLREVLYEQIIKKAISWQVSIIDCETIDEINILAATKLGMTRAIEGLSNPDLVLVDAVALQTRHKTLPIIKGDAKSYNIAAASIIAKVTRDRIMRELDKKYPWYDFSANKGYGTARHIAALRECGFCDSHRKTFIKNFFAIEGTGIENASAENAGTKCEDRK